MSRAKDDERTDATLAGAKHVVSRWRRWWGYPSDLDAMPPDEIAQLARDLSLTGTELRDLAARGPEACHLLYERMRTLGLTAADVERTAPGLMRDLQRTCSCCADKRVCERELAASPDSPGWTRYCPNAESLTAVKLDKDGR